MEIASIGIRVLGAFVDFVALLVIGFLLSFVIGTRPETGVGFSFQGNAALVAFAVGFAYFIVTEAVWGGTPGKLLLNMRVVNEEDNGAIDWRRSIVRNLLRIVDGLPALYLVGFILALNSPKKQRLGDRVAKTVVIRI